MSAAAVLLAAKVALVLAVTAAAVLGARAAPARVRMRLLTCAVVAATAMPLLSELAPVLRVPLPRLVTADVPKPPPGDPNPAEGVNPAEAVVASDVVTATIPGRSAPPASRLPVWAVVWLLGAAAVAARDLTGLVRLGGLVRGSRPVEDTGWERALAAAAERSRCRRRVRLLCSDGVQVPVTAGVLRPVVVVPADAEGWSPDRREVVLTHEMIHVKRSDWVVRVVSHLMRAVHWYNPLAWWATSRLEAEQERACDDEVVARGVSRSRYAAHLLETARIATRRCTLAEPALGFAHRPKLEVRIMSILEPEQRPNRARISALAAAMVTLVLVPVIAAVQPGVRTASPELSQALSEIRDIEQRLEPRTDEIRELESRMRPHLDAMSELELEIDDDALAEIQARMEPYQRRLEEIAEEMAPIRAEIEAAAASIERAEIEALAERVEPHVAELEELHVRLEPFLERIEEIHHELEPLHAELEQVVGATEPIQRQSEELHSMIEPLQAEIEKVQVAMEPMLEEIGRAADRVRDAVHDEVERALRDHLASSTDATAPFGEAAARIIDLGDIRVDDGELGMDADRERVLQILTDLMKGHQSGARDDLESALAAAADEMSRFRVAVDLP